MATSRLSDRPPLTRRGTYETIATFAILVALLYLGAGIFVPLVLSILLAFALSPMVELLTHRLRLPDPVAVIVSVIAALVMLGVFAYVVGVQLVQIGAQLPDYQATVARKLHDIQQQLTGGGLFDSLKTAMGSLTEQLNAADSAARPSTPIPVIIANDVGNPLGVASTLLGTLAGPLATAAIVFIFLIFLLLGRGELQERFIRLVSRGGYSTTNLAIGDASQRVGRYLLLQLCINLGYGVAFGAGLLIIGVPGAILWGLIIMLFRYIPFIGGLLVASIPMLLAFSVDSGWGMLLSTVVLFLVIDLTTANVIEPRVYGSSTGVSPIAILLSAMFWATLWGPVGLILATPMTVCLVVIGRYIPQFRLLETLLGSEPVLAPPERLYQRMLKGRTEEAIELAEETIAAGGLYGFQDDVLLPALQLASSELSDAPEALAQRRVLTASIDAVIEESATSAAIDGPLVVLIGGRTEIDERAAKIVAQRLADQQVPSRVLPPMAVRQESIGRIDLEGAEVVCLVYFGTDFKAQARYVSRRLKFIREGVRIIVCQLGSERLPDSAEALRVDQVTHDLPGTLDEIDAYLDIATAAARLGAHQPFRGSGRGDDALGQALRGVADAMAVPVATINLIDDERHRSDADAYRLTEIIAERGGPLVIPTEGEAKEIADNPYLQSNGVSFYAGVPLILGSGQTVGALVIMDYAAHPFGAEDLAQLETLAADLVMRFGSAAGVEAARAAAERSKIAARQLA